MKKGLLRIIMIVVFTLIFIFVFMFIGAWDRRPKAEIKETKEVAQETQEIQETTQEATQEPIETVEVESEADIYDLLAWVVYGEVGRCNDDYESLYLTACVILNRSEMFGESIEQVIYAKNQWAVDYYESLSASGYYPDARCYEAVIDALNDNRSPRGLIYCDSLSGVPNGCSLYYESSCGQRFYEVEV